MAKTEKEIKAKVDEMLNAYMTGVRQCTAAQEVALLNGTLITTISAMLGEIAMQLAEMNERARQRSVEPSNDESLAAMLLRELRDEEIKTA